MCKGYFAGPVTGIFKDATKEAVLKLKNDALGIKCDDCTVTPMWFKAILNSDALTCSAAGKPSIR